MRRGLVALVSRVATVRPPLGPADPKAGLEDRDAVGSVGGLGA